MEKHTIEEKLDMLAETMKIIDRSFRALEMNNKKLCSLQEDNQFLLKTLNEAFEQESELRRELKKLKEENS